MWDLPRLGIKSISPALAGGFFTEPGGKTITPGILFFFICSGFCHTLKWNSHGFTCVPHPDPPSPPGILKIYLVFTITLQSRWKRDCLPPFLRRWNWGPKWAKTPQGLRTNCCQKPQLAGSVWIVPWWWWATRPLLRWLPSQGSELLKIHPESPFFTFIASFVCSVHDPGCILALENGPSCKSMLQMTNGHLGGHSARGPSYLTAPGSLAFVLSLPGSRYLWDFFTCFGSTFLLFLWIYLLEL